MSPGFSDGIVLDTTKPTVSAAMSGGAAGANGWYTSDVTVSFTCSDTGSGIPAGTYPADQTLSAEGTAVSSTTRMVTDAAGNTSDASNMVTVMIDKTCPTITVTSPADLALVPVGTALAFSAQDSTSGPVAESLKGELTDGTTIIQVSSGYQPTVGLYSLVVTDLDAAGNSAQSQPFRFTVCDPEGGFATGAGFIDSPAEAHEAVPTLTGRAFFGFVSKYEKGATVPMGRTAFEFKAANLDFHATSFQWLVVNKASSNAQFEGAGLINGQQAENGQDYKFQLWATSASPDTFRIKIWWEDAGGNEHVVYDNGTEQAISGGSIAIHAK